MAQAPKPAEPAKPGGKRTWVIVGAVVVIVIVVVAGLYLTNFFGSGTPVSILDEGNSTACGTTGDTACKFDPTPLTISKGTTVKWTNKGGITHTVTSSSGAPASFDQSLDAGKSYSFQFTVTGKYNYTCTIHSWMKGQVIVNP